MRFCPFILILLSYFPLSAQNSLADNYINSYKDIAIREMNRTGIPASITLAQGLLESNWGRSTLAIKSNNHFGIKCSGNWSGDTHHRYDDDYDEFGRKRKSCFRAYDHAEASFIDHSDFLTDPKKNARYGFLFEFRPDDYQSWAHGLSRAGYATDPAYAGKLIQIIEKYDLHRFDISDLEEVEIYALEELNDAYKIRYINSCKVVIAKGGENLKNLSSELGISSRKLLQYNGEIPGRKSPLNRGHIIYLENKKNYYLGDDAIHLVNQGEDLAMISNEYGIDLEYLQKINRMDENQKLKAGDKVKLKRNATRLIAMRPAKTSNQQKTNKKPIRSDHSIYLFEEALTPVKN